MARNFTDDEIQRMVLAKRDAKIKNRNWEKDKIKQELKNRGFTLSDFENACSLPVGSVSAALKRRYPQVDKLIAAFLNVHESVIWPNRYLRNGVSISATYDVETMTDEDLEKLNRSVMEQTTRIEIILTPDGTVRREYDLKPPKPVNHDLLKAEYELDDQGRIIAPMADGIVYDDVSPMANERRDVKLPFNVDKKSSSE